MIFPCIFRIFSSWVFSSIFEAILVGFWDTLGTRFGIKARPVAPQRHRNHEKVGGRCSMDPPWVYIMLRVKTPVAFGSFEGAILMKIVDSGTPFGTIFGGNLGWICEHKSLVYGMIFVGFAGKSWWICKHKSHLLFITTSTVRIS